MLTPDAHYLGDGTRGRSALPRPGASASTKSQGARRPFCAPPANLPGAPRWPHPLHAAATLSSGGASGSRTALSLSSFMLETPARRRRWRAAQPPESSAAAGAGSSAGRALTPLSRPRPARAAHSSAAARRPHSSPATSPGPRPHPAPQPPFHPGGARPPSSNPGQLASFRRAPGTSAHAHSHSQGPGDPPMARFRQGGGAAKVGRSGVDTRTVD